MRTFNEFRDIKEREGARHLRIIMRVLEHAGFTVDDFTQEDDPFVFLHVNDERLNFGGVRVYTIGDTISYRVQNEPETQPYGKAYALDVEHMFNDLMSENGDENKSGKEVMEYIAREFKKFFERSLEAETKLRASEVEDRRITDDGPIYQKQTGSGFDFATTATTKVM